MVRGILIQSFRAFRAAFRFRVLPGMDAEAGIAARGGRRKKKEVQNNGSDHPYRRGSCNDPLQ